MITQNYNLNLIPNSAITLVKCSQFDRTLRNLTFNLFEGSTVFQIPAGTTATISGTKPDKTGFSYEMTVGTSSVTIDVTEQMTAVAGPVVCEITLTDGSGQISSTNFVLQVEPSALAGTVISETEIPILQEAIEAAETVVSLSETFGSPLVAQTAAEMTLTNRVYVYTGSESGYTYGNWYYYDGTAWRSGGVYQPAAVVVDSALSTTSQNPVQNKVITEELSSLKNAVNQKAPVIISHAEGSVASFSDGADDMPVSELMVNIDYSASGWTGVNVQRTGKNLLPLVTWSDWVSASPYVVLKNKLPKNTRLKMIISDNDTSINIGNASLGFIDSSYTGGAPQSNQYRWIIQSGVLGSYRQNIPVNNDATVYLGSLLMYPTTEETFNKIFSRYNIMIEIGTDDADYESYNGQTYSIDWTSEAGTVYGGTLDVTTGVLTSTLAADGSPLAIPVTYQLTPTEVKTLLGTNNIFADTGDSSVDYCTDTKLYIDQLSKSDSDMIADTNIASGKYFTVNNKLYLSTAAIAQGASIVVGTNCTETNLAEALNALNA